MSTVAIFGPGLIGGSLALALRSKRPGDTIRLWTRSEKSAAAAAQSFEHVFTDAAAAAEGADICVFCTPIGAMEAIAKVVAPVMAADGVATDAGSVKGNVVRTLEPIFGSRFVGSHPMAGSERSGLSAARADLFEGATAVVTPTATSAHRAIAEVESMWRDVGSRIVVMSPAEHDEAVARISHLPHAAAAALVNAINRRLPEAQKIAGGGYRDTTRIAAGPPAMWSEILLENKAALIAGLEDFTHTLEELKSLLNSDNAAALEAYLSRAKEVRDNLP
ncbi:prephenate dehydrogenase/arogenate dehydrogenase family protein [Spartobacteria bacterium LR76]|nr:prephenate dehydrogenase/arogenate dehydrogenase family protein [Spartobacteria bacterium LR76]